MTNFFPIPNKRDIIKDVIEQVSLEQSNPSDFKQEVMAMKKAKDINGVCTMLVGAASTIFGRKDVEGIFQTIAKTCLLTTTVDTYLNQLTTVIVEDKDLTMAGLRIKLLVNLYNLLPSTSAYLCTLSSTVVTYASNTNQIARCKTFLKQIETTSTMWVGVSDSEKRILFLSCADALLKVGAEVDELQFLVSYLQTFSDDDDNSLTTTPAVQAVAFRAVSYASQNPHSFEARDALLASHVIQQLKSVDSFTPAYVLLDIVARDSYNSYLKFLNQYPNYIVPANTTAGNNYGIVMDKEKLGESIRLLTLCSLAVDDTEVLYTTVAGALNISLSDVEYWVVLAITKNLIVAQMDQLSQVVIMTRSHTRVFDKKQWSQLSSKLHSWKANLETMIASIRHQQSEGLATTTTTVTTTTTTTTAADDDDTITTTQQS